jgi:hypothetical protein
MEQVKKEARLPPGFRFRPTDEELIVHYLRRRALAAPLPVDMPDIRVLAHDPSELLPPGEWVRLASRSFVWISRSAGGWFNSRLNWLPGWGEPERYFFTCKEAKYVRGRRANRATGGGYWKATGKEKPVAVPSAGRAVLVGMKRSLVFYRGKPPSGSRTDWVMHEYRLAGAGLAPPKSGEEPAEGWVLCRVFRKKGASSATASSGPGGAEEEEAAAGSGFIDFFARASSPVVSSSCLTDEQQCREQETTSRGDASRKCVPREQSQAL